MTTTNGVSAIDWHRSQTKRTGRSGDRAYPGNMLEEKICCAVLEVGGRRDPALAAGFEDPQTRMTT